MEKLPTISSVCFHVGARLGFGAVQGLLLGEVEGGEQEFRSATAIHGAWNPAQVRGRLHW